MKPKLYKIDADEERYWVASILSEEETKEAFLKEIELNAESIAEVPEEEWAKITIHMDEDDEATGERIVTNAKELVCPVMNEKYPIDIIASTAWFEG